MATVFTPPTPPKSLFGIDKRIELYRQMLADLEEQFAYQQEAIAFHTRSLELLQTEAENTRNELKACQEIVQSLTNTSQLTSTLVSQPQTVSSNGHQTEAIEPAQSEEIEEVTAKTQSEPKTKAKAKSPSKSKAKVKTPAKANRTSSTKTIAKTKSSKSKPSVKAVTTLPPSEVVARYERITAMVLDFVKSQEGVIEVADLIKYAYPDGLDEAQYKKASTSFSSVLGTQTKKGVLERTVPGKYMWKGQK